MRSSMLAEIRHRQEKLFASVKANEVYIPNFLNEPAFYYFTDLPYGKFAYNSLLLKRNGERIVISNALQERIVARFSNRNGFKVASTRKAGSYWKTLRKIVRCKHLGINYADVTLALAKKLRKELRAKLVDVRKPLEKIREIKAGCEIKRIEKAARIVSAIIEDVPDMVRSNMSERQLADAIEADMRQHNLEPAFDTIVACAKNGMVPHHVASNTKLCKGFLIVDAGVRYKNYCSDVSRTFYIGKATKKDKALYETVLHAKRIAEEKLKSGIKASKLFNSANEFLKSRGFNMSHAIGHGIGLEAHDFPGRITDESSFVFRPNMCFAIEPAIYGPFGGIRIEDDYLVTRRGPKKLSDAPDELLSI